MIGTARVILGLLALQTPPSPAPLIHLAPAQARFKRTVTPTGAEAKRAP